MKAMILAAGKGTRVRPLTYELPKPMIPILGKPVMAYLVEYLARYGVREIMVNVSHMHEKIEDYFGEGQRYGVHIGYSFEGSLDAHGNVVPDPCGSAGGIKLIQEFSGFFDETTLVLCGDALVDLDLNSALFEHRRNKALASVITREVTWDKVSDYGVVVADTLGRVKSFQEKPAREAALSNLASTGIYIFEPAVIDFIPANRPFDIGSQLFPLLVEHNVPFFAQRRHFNWVDIGQVQDYWAVQQRVMRGELAGIEMPGKQIFDGIWVGLNIRIDWENTHIEGPVYIGSSVHVEPGCHIIGPTWIGHGSYLQSGCKVSRSVLFEYTQVKPHAMFGDAVVFGNYCVDRNGNMRLLAEQGEAQWADARGAHAHRSPCV